MKILILGGNGFIGTNAVRYFHKKGDDVYFSFHTNSEKTLSELNFEKKIKIDLLKEHDVKFLFDYVQPEIVMQFAATTSGSNDIVNRPYYHVTDNAVMNSLILRQVFETPSVKHFIFPSSTTVYPPYIYPDLCSEDFVNGIVHEKYFGVAHTKLYIEKMCEFYSKICNKRFTVIRHANMYGPYDKFDLERSHVFGAMMTKIMNAKDGDEIEVWGDGKEGKDLLYISDLMEFLDLLISSKKTCNFQIFNVGSDYAISIKDLVLTIAKVLGKNITLKFNKSKPTIPFTVALNSQKARNLGWEEKISLEEGIRETYKWLCDQQNTV